MVERAGTDVPVVGLEPWFLLRGLEPLSSWRRLDSLFSLPEGSPYRGLEAGCWWGGGVSVESISYRISSASKPQTTGSNPLVYTVYYPSKERERSAGSKKKKDAHVCELSYVILCSNVDALWYKMF